LFFGAIPSVPRLTFPAEPPPTTAWPRLQSNPSVLDRRFPGAPLLEVTHRRQEVAPPRPRDDCAIEDDLLRDQRAMMVAIILLATGRSPDLLSQR